MQADLATILLGFIEGFALISSPCILPILPLVLAGSLENSKLRPWGIISGFTLSFTLFAFFSRQFVQYSGIDLELVRHLSYLLLLLLGLVMLSSTLSGKFSQFTQRLSSLGTKLSTSAKQQSGFLSGLYLGSLIALIWTPCAGPILAAIILQTVIQKTTILSFFTLLAFAMGAALPMLIIAFYGRKIINSFGFFKSKAGLLRKILGAVIIASVVYMVYQERNLSISTLERSQIKTVNYLQDGLWHPYPAPEIAGIAAWLNSPPLCLVDLRGKVVLIDFWTYSCINCLRTLPYLNYWYEQYQSKGLVIIGAHTPEFDFEKNLDNVKNAVKRYGIHYPVALDNQFETWRNFNNHYWPAHYLINKQGKVVYEHFGEGAYEVIENNIRFLLGLNSVVIPKHFGHEGFSFTLTGETYLGYARADRDYSPYLYHDKAAQYSFPPDLAVNSWALQGAWQVKADKIIATKAKAALKIHFQARKVFIVMGNSGAKPIRVQVFLNGQALRDLDNSSILVDKHRLYEVLVQAQFASGILQIKTTEPGLEVYTFTFGS